MIEKQPTMTYIEYQSKAQRTCPSIGSVMMDKIHMIMGMFDEWDEYQDEHEYEKLEKELGDIFWYAANLARIEGFKFNTGSPSSELSMNNCLARMQGLYKKHLAYGKEPDKNLLEVYFQVILWNLYNECRKIGAPPSEVFIRNIAKLKARYPDGFTQEKAINKNEDNE